MPQLRDFQAAVVVDEVELPEYTIQVSRESDEISCYIPSEVGKNFAVKWRDLNLQRDTAGYVHLDGAFACSQQIVKSSTTREVSRSDYRVTSETVRPFCFAHLSLTGDESCANPAENKLGEVQIELYELLSYKCVPFPPDWKRNEGPEVVRIHEHSKKVMTHCVGYGEDMKRKAARKMITGVVKGKRLATFVFRYRALDMLQAQGITPPPPPPPPPQPAPGGKRQRCKEEDTEDVDDGEADKAMLKILKAEISKIEARLLKRQKTMVKSEDKAHVIANEVIELD